MSDQGENTTDSERERVGEVRDGTGPVDDGRPTPRGHRSRLDRELFQGTPLERVATGATWAEGPLWLPARRVVLWSDIPGNRILEFSATTGETRVYRQGAEFTNGRTLDERGTIVQCSHGRRAVERDTVGVIETLVDAWGVHRLNSPNDVVVASDGAIWFTDPPYGIVLPSEGHPGTQEYGGSNVFRFDETTRQLSAEITDMVHPNGLAFSPDESILYVSDTSAAVAQSGSGYRHIRAYPLIGRRRVGDGCVFAELDHGVPDGIRVDEAGRLWSSSAEGVLIYSPAGRLLHRLEVPEVVANLCFGGDDGRDLYITATTSLYRIRTRVRDAAMLRRRDRGLGIGRSINLGVQF